MKRNSIFRKILSIAFAAAIVFTVSVREIHYLFSHQHQSITEHCENHLHDASHHHDDCSVCKFDVSLFTDVLVAGNSSFIAFGEQFAIRYHSPALQSSVLTLTLRGPPALA